ncbi:MAG: lysophospholipase [Clostridia bacterium]|nr:lysophospholipase [Clostridia bacterium]
MTNYDKKIRNSIIALVSAVAILGITVVISYFVIYGPHGITLLGNKNKKALSYASGSASAKQGSTVFFGDSITEMCDLNAYYPNVNSYNRGISGDTTENMLKRVETNVLALAPSNIVFLGGTNDIGKNVPPQDIANNIEQIIQKTQQALPDCKIFIQSVYPVNPTRKPTFYSKTGNRTNDTIDALNLLIQEFCYNYGCTYIDVNSYLKDQDGNLQKAFSIDGLHLTKQGYEKVSRIVAPYLEDFV